MDAERFNALTRTVAAMTRRRGVRLLTAGVLGSLLVRLGLSPVAASHGCRHVGKPCTKGQQCCAGARCKNGACKCKALYFKCGTLCCLDGAACLPIPLPDGPLSCLPGTKQAGQECDPTKPGQCASGRCTPIDVGGSVPICREADCEAAQGPCESGAEDCCKGTCFQAAAVCGDGQRCCHTVLDPCQADCDCCHFPEVACGQGKCCRPEFSGCPNSSQCCGSLVCDNGVCVKP